MLGNIDTKEWRWEFKVKKIRSLRSFAFVCFQKMGGKVNNEIKGQDGLRILKDKENRLGNGKHNWLDVSAL